jgi:hypothetical protein
MKRTQKMNSILLRTQQKSSSRILIKHVRLKVEVSNQSFNEEFRFKMESYKFNKTLVLNPEYWMNLSKK